MSLSVAVDGMTFSDPPVNGYTLAGLDGWTDGAPVRPQSTERVGQHGSHAINALRGGRVITVAGIVKSSSPGAVGTIRAALAAVLGDGGFGDLSVTEPDGLTTTASVQVNAAPFVRWNDRENAIEFQLVFFAPDPLRYGPLANATTAFPSLTGGLEFDLFTDGTTDTGYLEFGTPGSTGRVDVANPGTADSWPQYQVTGPTPPFTIVVVDTGDRLTMPRALSAGEVLLMDSATGMVTLNGGDVDYSGLLTSAQWAPIPRKSTRTIALLADGALIDSHAALTVISHPAWW